MIDYPSFHLMQFFEGYVRNYRRLNLSLQHNRSMFTSREIDYFARLGEWLGFESYIEDSKINKLDGRSRPMDLSWWKMDARIDKENYISLSMHLERENLSKKDEETMEKLFTETEEGYHPEHVIGIQYVDSFERIDYLNQMVLSRNEKLGSHALMIYRYYDQLHDLDRIKAYVFDPQSCTETRHAIAKLDQSQFWYMCFEEEWENSLGGNRAGEEVCGSS